MKKEFKKWICIGMSLATIMTMQPVKTEVFAAEAENGIGEAEVWETSESQTCTWDEVEKSAEIKETSQTFETASGTLVNKDGIWYYYENGVWIQDKYGIVDYNGGKFLVAHGVVAGKSGLVQYGGKWYFLSKGQVQTQYTGLAKYDGAWFYVENGILATDYNGIMSYDGSLFLISAGRIRYDYSGLFLNTDGEWYFLSCGQVQTQYTGLAQYDGAWFYIDYGILDVDYTGYTKYDGSVFYIENGQMTQNEYYMGLYQRAVSNRSTYASEIAEVWQYVNQYRSEAGSASISLDEDLCIAACIRAQEMADNDLFSHTRPNGTSCFTILEELSIEYRAAGENIAYGYTTAASVSDGWYHSPGHYSNMVDSDFNKIGVGLAIGKNGRKYWVQLFTD